MKTIQFGSTGDDVRKWQTYLRGRGILVGAADSSFGAKTEAATKAFQLAGNLKADGIVGAKTWRASGLFDDSPEPPVVATPPSADNNWPLERDAEAYFKYPPNLTQIEVPYQLLYENAPVTHITCNIKVAASLRRVLAAIKDAFSGDMVAIHKARADVYDGVYADRNVRGAAHRSMHAYGAAIDMDAEHNGLGRGHGTMHPFVIAAFKAEGWRWGGDYSGRTDPMHFEACR